MTDHDATMQVMERIFAPRSVAVVGVPRGMKTGRMFLEALLKPGFKGPIYPVNPNADEILGLKTYPSVSAIGEPVDLAIVATPPGAATSVIADCGRAGVAAAVLFTAGFGELGTPDGEARADELRSVAEEGGVRLIGPNCMGLYNPALGVRFGENQATGFEGDLPDKFFFDRFISLEHHNGRVLEGTIRCTGRCFRPQERRKRQPAKSGRSNLEHFPAGASDDRQHTNLVQMWLDNPRQDCIKDLRRVVCDRSR